MPEKTEDNMKLWNSVCTTKPSDTKHVNQRGGFTAICAQSQIMAATEQWGPYGGEWGMAEMVFGEIRDAAGELVEVTFTGTFQFPGGKFPIASDEAYRAGNDTRKKLLTDATTKALSKLGFNADVFLGLYDDNKYVQERRAEEAGDAPPPAETQSPPAAAPPVNVEQPAIDAIKQKMRGIFGDAACIAAKARVIDSDGKFIGEGNIKTLAEAQAFEAILNKGADK